uniref:PAS_6 domain-containing protein n=1 Tax=Strongyloides venezuelensis TaxID=75913 RepID=A0A0K0FED7_STRVS
MGREKKVKRNEFAFDFVSLSEALNRLVDEHQFIILIANENAFSIIHHDGAFFFFDLHSMNQNGKYCSYGVSYCNNSQFQPDGVNISVKDISGNKPDVSASK